MEISVQIQLFNDFKGAESVLNCENSMLLIYRSSHQMRSMKKGVLRNFAKFTGKLLCQSLFFNKVAGLMPATLLKKRLWHRCFPVNFVKFLRTPFLQNTSRRLLLYFFASEISFCKFSFISRFSNSLYD